MNSVLHNPKAFADRLYGSRLFDDCGLMAFAQRREAAVHVLLRSLREHLPTHEAALKVIGQLDDATTDYACEAHAEGLQLGIAIERSRQAIVAAAAEKEE